MADQIKKKNWNFSTNDLNKVINQLNMLLSILERNQKNFWSKFSNFLTVNDIYPKDKVIHQIEKPKVTLKHRKEKKSKSKPNYISVNQFLRKIDKPDPDPLWDSTDLFFQKVPNIEEYIELFNSGENMTASQMPEHWSVKFNEISNSVKHIKPSLRIPVIPNTDNVDNNMNDYWKTNRIAFPIEKSQKYTKSTLQFLLLSLVESTPISRIQSSEKRPKFRSIHYFAPQIPYHPYLSLSFDQKLEYELESIGLGTITNESMPEGPFTHEIKSHQNIIDSNIPRLIQLRDELLSQYQTVKDLQNRIHLNRQFFSHNYIQTK